mmetsp:Transcript_17270/g.46875  ORF Transcript_17270/g.46875 Transcript_17270/m.46875 type:complete len:335 (-) Transcript_17270:32-1036(-)
MMWKASSLPMAEGLHGSSSSGRGHGAHAESSSVTPIALQPPAGTGKDPAAVTADTVTLMVGQLPLWMRQLDFLYEVNKRGFEGYYDFLFVPFDWHKQQNHGYGFVNFISPRYAQAFCQQFEGTFLDEDGAAKGKPLVIYRAEVQGFEANYQASHSRRDPLSAPFFYPFHGQDQWMEQSHLGQAAHGMRVFGQHGVQASQQSAAWRLPLPDRPAAPAAAPDWYADTWAPPPPPPPEEQAPAAPADAAEPAAQEEGDPASTSACRICGVRLPGQNFCVKCSVAMLKVAEVEYQAFKRELGAAWCPKARALAVRKASSTAVQEEPPEETWQKEIAWQ